MNDDALKDSHTNGFDANRVKELQKVSSAVPDKEEEDRDGYAIISQQGVHPSQPHSGEVKKSSAGESGGHYSTPAPQSVYAQVDRKKSKELLGSSSGGEYAAISTRDPQSMYAQVGQRNKKKKSTEVCEDSHRGYPGH